MSNLSTEISYYLRIAIEINKSIGGTKAYEAQQKSKDKFSVLRETILRDFHQLRSMIETQERFHQEDDAEYLMEIKEKLREINSQIIRMKSSVEGGESSMSGGNTKELKLQIIEKIQEQYAQYDKLVQGTQEEGDETARELLGNNSGKKKPPQTLTDMRAKLLDEEEGPQNRNRNKTKTKSKRPTRHNKNNEPTEIEMQKMKEYEKANEEIDEGVDVINEKILQLKNNFKQTGQLLDQTDQKVKDLTNKVDTVSSELVNANKRLKDVVEKFRKPHKFCIDIILVVILIGLIIGIIKVASG